MRPYERPAIRPGFRDFERQPHVYFYTSSVDKFLHLKTLLDRYGLLLRYYKSHTEPYPEDYSASTADLLQGSLRAVRDVVGPARVFFIEDTTIRIEALSGEQDYPGLGAKEWFLETTFAKLDAELRGLGNDRRATVRSDMALNVPGLERPIMFHGETAGTIAEEAPAFSADALHRWLTPQSFNGWFIPNGASIPLGAMKFEESLPFDFRAKAVVELVDRLEEFVSVLNLPPSAYGTAAKKYSKSPQLLLLPSRRLMVIGMTCAGKTTFGEYAQLKHNYSCVEASSVVRSLWREDPRGLNLGDFAESLLRESGADFVARYVLGHFGDKLSDSCVITGFRLLEEIEAIKDEIGDVDVILVEASERSRFARYLARAGREVERQTETFDAFVAGDVKQWNFGLLRVARDTCDVVVVNDGSLEEYYEQVEAVLSGREDRVAGVLRTPPPDLQRHELYRCLSSLAEADRSMNPGEIAKATTDSGYGIRANNANKALKAIPELARRLERGPRVRYAITDAGRTYLRLLERRRDGLHA